MSWCVCVCVCQMTYTLSKVMMCGSVIDRQHLDGLSSSMTTYNENWQINSTIGQFKFKSCYNKCMKMFLIIPRCTVLLLFYWSWSCPVLIQWCIITSTRSTDSGLEVITVSCNIWVVMVACIIFDYFHCLFLLFLSLACFYSFLLLWTCCVWNKLHVCMYECMYVCMYVCM